MKPETFEWVEKAEGDFNTACRENQVYKHQNYDAVCFHSQQCAEKYLKARLVEDCRWFPKIHDIEALLNLVLPLEPSWEDLREDLQCLTDMAVEVRYPGVTADAEDAALALGIAERVRGIVRMVMGIE